MTITPVGAKKVARAKAHGLQNVDAAALACRTADLPFWAACALLEKESGGRNVYGHDVGGALSGYPAEVDASNFAVFQWLVGQGAKSNGVGPCQITYFPHFAAMTAQHLVPWNPVHNMIYGFDLLAGYRKAGGSWTAAGKRYNGRASYGEDLAVKCNEWRARLFPNKTMPAVS